MSSSQSTLLKRGHLELLAQDWVQTAFEYLQDGRLHKLLGQTCILTPQVLSKMLTLAGSNLAVILFA